jgi:cob(I)alamin adenosyltransferase
MGTRRVKIYTKTGDGGETSLLGGLRVAKDHLRVSAYGEIDELQATLGVVRVFTGSTSLGRLLASCQRDLFALGAQLADPTHKVANRRAKAAVRASQIRRLEKAIDVREPRLVPLRSFVLPGGSKTGALLHLARTICRRAERTVVTLSRETDVDPRIVAYLNRLADLLFVLAREANYDAGIAEDCW